MAAELEDASQNTEEGSVELAEIDGVINGGFGSPREGHRHRRHHHHDRHRPHLPDRSISDRLPRKHPNSLRRHQSTRVGCKTEQGATAMSSAVAWGHRSTPSISIKDIRGGEKNATEVEKIHTIHNREVEAKGHPRHRHHNCKTPTSDFRGGAQTKIENIIKSKKVKQGRRSEVKNSLASFLQTTGATASDGDDVDEDENVLEEVDDESLISDEEEAIKARNSTRFKVKRRDTSDYDNKSVKSAVSRSQSARRLGRTSRTLDERGGSSHSRKGGVLRRRSGDLDDLSIDGSSRRDSRRRSTSRPRPRPVDDGEDNKSVGSSRRTRSRGPRDARSVDAASRRDVARSVDASSRRRRSASRGADSVREGGGGDGGGRGSRGGRGRSSNKTRDDDDDDKSVGSRKSVATASGRRGRRPSKPRHAKPSHNRLPPAQHSTSDERGIVKLPSPSPSPEVNMNFISRSTPTLSNHIESAHEREEKKVDVEEASEESSRFSAGNTAQSVLLQFDPSNADNVRTVNQSKARTTSETIRHADGTESKLQISELAGLPTFERPERYQESGESGLSAEIGQASSRSMDSIDADSSVERPQKPGSLRSADNVASSGSQNPGEAPAEAARKPPRAKVSTAPRQRGMQATKSFIQRMHRSKPSNNNYGEENNLFSGFIGRPPRGLSHQALDDDDSLDD